MSGYMIVTKKRFVPTVRRVVALDETTADIERLRAADASRAVVVPTTGNRNDSRPIIDHVKFPRVSLLTFSGTQRG